MSLVQGNVSVDANGTASGTGFAKVYFDALLAVSSLPDPTNASLAYGPNPLDDATTAQLVQARLATLQAMATQANLAAVIIPYLLANAVITLSGATATIATTVSTGRIPATATVGSPIDGPAAAVVLPISGGGSLT